MRFGDTVSKWRDFTLIGFCWFPTSEGADMGAGMVMGVGTRPPTPNETRPEGPSALL